MLEGILTPEQMTAFKAQRDEWRDATRPVNVWTQTPEGLQPHRLVLGLADESFSEIVRGDLKAGDSVVARARRDGAGSAAASESRGSRRGSACAMTGKAAEQPQPDGQPVLSCRDLTKTYVMGEQTLQVLRGVSFDVRPGEFVAVMGPSGSGKSTLLNLIGALDTPTSGALTIAGTDISDIGRRRSSPICATASSASCSSSSTFCGAPPRSITSSCRCCIP